MDQSEPMSLEEQEELATSNSSCDFEKETTKRKHRTLTDNASTSSASTSMAVMNGAPAPTRALEALNDEDQDKLRGECLLPEGTLLRELEFMRDMAKLLGKPYPDEWIISQQNEVGIKTIFTAMVMSFADGDERVTKILIDACRIMIDANNRKTKFRASVLEHLRRVIQVCWEASSVSLGSDFRDKIKAIKDDYQATKKHLQLFYQNVRGLRTKTDLLYNSIIAAVADYDILLFTETWLHGGILDSKLSDNRFDIFRCDRGSRSDARRGGGVMVACTGRLCARAPADLVPPDLECVWITIPSKVLAISRDLHIAVVYLPPNRYLPIRVDAFLNMLSNVMEKYPNDYIIVSGDFNLPCIDWQCEIPTFIKKGLVAHGIAKIFVQTMSSIGLKQYNVLTNKSDNTLDLIFSNIPLDIITSFFPVVPEDMSHSTLDIYAWYQDSS